MSANHSIATKLMFVSALLSLARLASLTDGFAAAAPAKYVVGYATHVARVLPLWLAGELKFFLKHGVDIDPVFIRGVDRKPFASLEGLRNVQRLLRTRNPKVGEVKAEDIINNRIMRKLDEGGFIDRTYVAHGAKL